MIRAGLTKNEATVYVTLLSLGTTKANAVAKKTGIFRSKVYESLDRLAAKGLVSEVKINGIKHFQAASPQRLASMITEKEDRLHEFRTMELPAIISALSIDLAAPQTELEVYSGPNGVKTLLDNMLEELQDGGAYVAFAGGEFKPKMQAYYNQFQKKKKRLNVRSKFLYDESMRKDKAILSSTQGKWRFHDKKYHSPTDMFIFNDKLIMTIWNSKPYFALYIRNKEVASVYRDYFDLIWRISKP
mgnify:FL=1